MKLKRINSNKSRKRSIPLTPSNSVGDHIYHKCVCVYASLLHIISFHCHAWHRYKTQRYLRIHLCTTHKLCRYWTSTPPLPPPAWTSTAFNQHYTLCNTKQRCWLTETGLLWYNNMVLNRNLLLMGKVTEKIIVSRLWCMGRECAVMRTGSVHGTYVRTTSEAPNIGGVGSYPLQWRWYKQCMYTPRGKDLGPSCPTRPTHPTRSSKHTARDEHTSQCMGYFYPPSLHFYILYKLHWNTSCKNAVATVVRAKSSHLVSQVFHNRLYHILLWTHNPHAKLV